ncbi:MAG: hypothetical protein HY537_08895 [Deltaproteobacteria bacterium]|nr:hypothetical protein [Deltaproteobacteria bacterium]
MITLKRYLVMLTPLFFLYFVACSGGGGGNIAKQLSAQQKAALDKAFTVMQSAVADIQNLKNQNYQLMMQNRALAYRDQLKSAWMEYISRAESIQNPNATEWGVAYLAQRINQSMLPFIQSSFTSEEQSALAQTGMGFFQNYLSPALPQVAGVAGQYIQLPTFANQSLPGFNNGGLPFGYASSAPGSYPSPYGTEVPGLPGVIRLE